MTDRVSRRPERAALVIGEAQRVAVERLDLVQFHWWDMEVPGYVEAAGWLQELQQAARVITSNLKRAADLPEGQWLETFEDVIGGKTGDELVLPEPYQLVIRHRQTIPLIFLRPSSPIKAFYVFSPVFGYIDLNKALCLPVVRVHTRCRGDEVNGRV